MPRSQPIEPPPPRPESAVSPWVEISAWILAFAILLAAQCAPDRAASEVASRQKIEARQP
jgi:hypothetical protein